MSRVPATASTDLWELCVKHPDPILTTPAEIVEEFDAELFALGGRMKMLVARQSGDFVAGGLAAPQLGISLAVCVVSVPRLGIAALVNPVIVSASDELVTETEGCFSFPQSYRVPITRPWRISLVADGLRGEKIEADLDGHAARTVQHEVDHLNGITIAERKLQPRRVEAPPVAPDGGARVNIYDCPDCGGQTVTIDVDEGTTPMFLACRADGTETFACGGRAVSRGYTRIPADAEPGWEWFRPRSTKGMSAEMRDHVERGGLELRRKEAA